MDKTVFDYLEIGLIILAIVSFLIYFIQVNYRSSKRNNAPVETARATAYYKHPELKPVLNGRHSSYIGYITFHTDSGDILKLYMNPEHYYTIQEGAVGQLTWQSDRFWKFIPES